AAVGARTLPISATGLTGVNSATVTLTAGTATQLTVTTEPSSTAQSGVPFAQQPVIQVRDASGNPVSQGGVTVTAAIATGGGTLGGTLTATTTETGVATFTNRSEARRVGKRSLSLSATGHKNVNSATVTLTAGTATQLTVTTKPSRTAQSGGPWTQEVGIQVRDASGNPVSQAGVTVTVAIATGGGTLGGTLTATTTETGVATFTN